MVTLEPTSLTDAYATVKVLTQQAGCTQFQVIVNMAANEAQGRRTFQRLSSVTARFLEADVRYLGQWCRATSACCARWPCRSPLVDMYPGAPSPPRRPRKASPGAWAERASPKVFDRRRT